MSFTIVRMSLAAAALGLACQAVLPAALAQTGSGRFTMAPVEDGFVRLDKETGAMSMCRTQGDKWACRPMEDDQSLAEEVRRLQKENDDLRAEVRRLEDTFVGRGDSGSAPGSGPQTGGPPGGLPPGGLPGGGLPELQLPTEEQVDQAVDYLESMIRKFRERFEDFGDKTDPDRPRPRSEEAPTEEAPRSRGEPDNGNAEQSGPPKTTPL